MDIKKFLLSEYNYEKFTQFIFDKYVEIIEKVYKKLSDKNHKVAYNAFDIVKTIENK